VVDLDEEKLIVELVNCALIRVTSCECSKATRAAGRSVLLFISKAKCRVQIEPARMKSNGKILREHEKGLGFFTNT